jgi:hypothetical protein
LLNAPLWTPSGELTAVPPVRQAANDNLPPVVGLTGLAGSGKSTAASYLVERHNYTRVRFAGPLKAMMRAVGLSESQIEGADKEKPCRMLAGKTPRHAMQTLGTEWGSNCIGADFWIFLWTDAALKVLDNGGRVVVDDCRFPNEAAAVRRLGGDIYRLQGRGGIAGSHVSERMDFVADCSINNGGEIEDLHDGLMSAMCRWG